MTYNVAGVTEGISLSYPANLALIRRLNRYDIAAELVDAAQRPLSDHLAVAVEFEWQRDVRPERAAQ